MATDIVERLRSCLRFDEPNLSESELEQCARLSADEIERLRAEVADSIKAIDTLHDQRRELEAERDRLRELLPIIDGMIDTPCPTPLQWKLIGEKAKQLRAALKEGS